MQIVEPMIDAVFFFILIMISLSHTAAEGGAPKALHRIDRSFVHGEPQAFR